MQRFFSLVFGGLTAVFVGVLAAWAISRIGTIRLIRTIHYVADPLIRHVPQENVIDQTAEIMVAHEKSITATSYFMRDVTTGAVVAEGSQDKLVPIASLTKLVTAVVARRLIPDNTKITITPAIEAVYGNTAGFRVGETFTASDLMYPLLMVSSNDAAEAFAAQYGRARFIKAMNDFTQSIGAYRTYFADASGLSPSNESTANDVALILEWIYKNDPTVLSVTELKSKTIRTHTWINPAHFLSWSYYLGGKNGYTDEADNTSAGLFRLGPRNDVYVIVTLGSADRDNDIIDLLQKIQ